MKVCTQCGWENDDELSLCLGCGSPLGEAVAAPDKDPEPQKQPPSALNTNIPSPTTPEVAAMSDSPARLVLLLPNGQEGGTYPLKPDKTLIGRQQGNILFLDDPYVSPLHATFHRTPNNGMIVRDENSLNGLFLRLREKTPLEHSDVLLIGKQLFLFEKIQAPPPDEDGFDPHTDAPSPVWGSPYSQYWGRVMQMISGGKRGNAILLGGEQVDMGRERGQITFPGDRYISAIHARISFQNNQYALEDLGSRNGTFIRIRKEQTLRHNDVLIIGEQLLRVEFQ